MLWFYMIRFYKLNFINDKAGKPVGIYQHIGRRPILVFSNSDSDMQMIEYTTAGKGRCSMKRNNGYK